MAIRQLFYESESEPIEIEHSIDARPGVGVRVRTSLGVSFQLQPGMPVRHTIKAPIPPSIQIVYLAGGPPFAHYEIRTSITQGGRQEVAIERGTLLSSGMFSYVVAVSSQPLKTTHGQGLPPLARDDASRDRLPGAGLSGRASEAPGADTFQPPLSPPPPAAPTAAQPSLPPPASARRGRLGGGAGRSVPAKQAPPRAESGRYTVWFGTNREPVYKSRRLTGFSSDRSETVHYGSCRVAIPESHTIGSIGSSWWKRLITRKDDRLKLLTLTTLAEAAYWNAIAGQLRAREPDERDAVVFVHGYNVSFHEAALRAAQLGFDLGVSGVMAFYSWPSKGTLQGYPADEATIEASEGFISDFLTHMAERSKARRVHIIAHSMGNRGVLRAIDRIATAAAQRTHTPFDQIILAAADVDQDTFKRLSVAYQRVARRTTMYVCSKDRAVEASHWLHDFPRAGLAPPVLVVPGIDTINVSNLDLTLLGHGYVAEARELLTDIHALLRDGTPPARRFGLRKMTSPAGDYWTVGR